MIDKGDICTVCDKPARYQLSWLEGEWTDYAEGTIPKLDTENFCDIDCVRKWVNMQGKYEYTKREEVKE